MDTDKKHRLALLVIGSAVFFHFIAAGLYGLDPAARVQDYLVDKWEMTEGIPSNTIISIAQTPDGYLWIATSRGLVRFDGIKFSIISNTAPDALYVDKAGTLWIGSLEGLTSYRYRTGAFNVFTAANGLTKDRIRVIKEDMKGNLWISLFTDYLDCFSGGTGKFTHFNESHGLEGNKINAIVEDRKGNLLLGSRENGVFVYRDGKFSRYPVTGLENVLIIAMQEDRDGDLWIGTNNGLFRITANGTREYTTQDGLSNNYITGIIRDSDGNTWAGTVNGLNRIKKNQDGTIAIERVLTPFTITFVFEDIEKSLWVGTYDSGVKRLKDSKFTFDAPYVAPDTKEEEIILSIFEDRAGDIWLGTLGGRLLRQRGAAVIETVEIPPVSGAGITSIADDADGNLWIGTNGKGVIQKKGGAFTRFTTGNGLADNQVTSIFRDTRGMLWFGTFDGVSRYYNRAIQSLKSSDGLSGKVVLNVYEDWNHDILIASDKGIDVLKDGNLSKTNIAHFLKDVPVPVTYVYEDRDPDASKDGGGVLWIATQGEGLKRLKGGKLFSYTTAEGMATNIICQFFEDRWNNFWIMSDSGILRVNKKELNLLADGKSDRINCASYGISDGMRSLEFNNELSRHSAISTRDGKLRFITKKGITIVNPAAIRIDNAPPPVVIERVLFNEEPVSLRRDGEANIYKGITDTRFYFTAPTFLSPEKIRFKFRLVGADSNWVYLPVGKERVARYKNLAPGNYIFRVTACNNEGVWNQAGDSMTFTLKPLYYKTVLFKIIVVILFIALGAAAFYIYKKRPFDKREKYKGSPLNPQFAVECVKKLTSLMENEKLYRDPGLSLQSLSEKMSVTAHQLSQLLNEKLSRSFSDYINYYRVEEAKVILLDPARKDLKIILVAGDVGFNTTVAFYNAFRKYTGMTPARFKKLAQKEK